MRGSVALVTRLTFIHGSVTNAARHAKASSVAIEVSATSTQVSLAVTDDGVGITAQQLHSPDRFGLLGMRERVQGVGGTLAITHPAEGGTRIVVQLPLPSSGPSSS